MLAGETTVGWNTTAEEGDGVHRLRKVTSISERLRGDLGDSGIGGGEEFGCCCW